MRRYVSATQKQIFILYSRVNKKFQIMNDKSHHEQDMKIIYLKDNLACFWGWPCLEMFKISKDWYEFYDGNDYSLLIKAFPEEKVWIDKFFFLHENEGIGDHAYFSILNSEKKYQTSRDQLTYLELQHSEGVIKSFLTQGNLKKWLNIHNSEGELVTIEFDPNVKQLTKKLISEAGLTLENLEINKT